MFRKLAKLKKKELKDTPYAGAEACKNCHQKAYKKWKESNHAHAILTLKKKGKSEDSSCISCHVLGWQQKGGYASEELTPNFAGVQCENCHSPRKDHVKDPRIKQKHKSINLCQNCHNSSHSPEFDKQLYWKKILHY